MAVILLPAASASHWCSESTIAIGPSDPIATRSTTFTVSIANTGVDNTQLAKVEMKFSWEGTWHNAGSGTVLAGQSNTYSATATPPSAGSYSVEVKATGTSSGDWLHETAECSASADITATAPPAGALPGFEAAFVVLALVGAGLAVAAAGRR